MVDTTAPIDFGHAATVLKDDASPKGQTYLERVDEKKWRIVLPGKSFFITAETLRKLAQEHIVTAHPDKKGIFLPANT